MALNDTKTFSFVDPSGLTLQVVATDLGGGKTSFVVTSLEGAADINALYWHDGVDDGAVVDLGKSLNMNGSGEDWDGAIKLSDAGIGKLGDAKPTYLQVGESTIAVTANVAWDSLDTIGIRATSTTTDGGSIKGVAEQVPELGGALFTENFDGYDSSVQQTYQDNGVDVFASVNLNAASGWYGTGSNPAQSELGANGYGTIETTSGGFWLDTQNTPGQINISHVFTDETAAIDGKTAVLSFDIAKQDLTYKGTAYQTEANASFEVRIDGVAVATILASDLATNNDMYHYEIDLAGYADMGDNSHTISLVDTSPQSDVTGFSVDSIQINDWVLV